MKTLWVDIETRSRVDLRNSTPYRYSEDPAFEILMAAWSTDGETVNLSLGHSQTLADLWKLLIDPTVLKVAHNAQFERICFSRALDWEGFLPAEEWHDTMAMAGELGYPQSLGRLAQALGGEQKDEAGTRLINLFCKPNRQGGWNDATTHPMEWLDFITYCEQDVYTLIDVDRHLGRWSTSMEREVYLADQAINDAGIRIDVDLAQRAVEVAEENRVEQSAEFCRLTDIENPASNPQMMEWCEREGLGNTDMRKETVSDLLSSDLRPEVRRALELRQELALVAQKKFSSALASVSSDGRLRGSFRFFGAHTGRWTGKGTQLQNLPRAQLADETETDAAILDLKMGLGADAHTLKALVRALFVGPFVVVDYAAIEARVIAWLAGEEWALQAFRDGRDIYVETAERMSTPNRPLNRSQGKVAVLALGYNGANGSLRAMGAEGSDEDLGLLVRQWRQANPSIVRLWSRMEQAFRTGGAVGEHLSIEKDGTDRMIRLPSGRAICYRKCGIRNGRMTFLSSAGPRVDTYGGRLSENVTQAVARDVMAEALVRLVGAGYTVVGHVHDEVIVESDDQYGVEKLMLTPPEWADGLPIDGEGFTCRRYRKG